MANKWYVITGGPSTGKTTLLSELNKLGYNTVQEAARTLIDEAVSRGITPEELRADERQFQEEVTRLKEKVENQTDPNTLTFFDRGMQDTDAYLKYYNFKIADWIKELGKKSKYQKVFLLDPLPVFQEDYARTEDRRFAVKIQKLLEDTYSEYGMPPLRIKAGSVSDRLKIILDTVNKD